MPNTKITALPPASGLVGTEPIPTVQAGVTVRTTAAAIAALGGGSGGGSGGPAVIQFASSDETTPLTVGTNKITLRSPHNIILTEVRASLSTAGSTGTTVDVNKNGVSLLSTPITIDASEKTSETAAAPPVFADTTLADDDEITVDIDVAGTGAAGLKVTLIGTHTLVAPPLVLTYAPTLTVNLGTYPYNPVTFDLALEGDITFNFINGADGQLIRMRVAQDSGGGCIWTSGANIRASADVPSIVLSTGPSKLDYLLFMWKNSVARADILAVNKGF